MPVSSQSGNAPVHGGSLYYESAGNGPAILFIHAGVADHSMWDPQFEYFSNRFKVIRYDTRGYGKSRTDDVRFSHHQDVVDLLDHLGVEKTVLVGCSRGGQIAIDFTLAYPQRCLALVPVAAGVSGYGYKPDDSQKSKIELDIFTRADELESRGDIDGLNELEVNLWADGVGQPVGRAAPAVREKLRHMNLATFNREDGKPEVQPLDPPALERLASISAPTLVMVGEHDTSAVVDIARLLHDTIPGAQLEYFPNAAHMLSMEYPDRFNHLLAGFLDKVL